VSCVSELRGLGAVHEKLKSYGGRLLTVSVEEPSVSRDLINKQKLPFSIVADVGRDVTKAYGVLNVGGGLNGEDIPIPSHYLIDPKQQVRWLFHAPRVTARPSPTLLVDTIEQHFGPHVTP